MQNRSKRANASSMSSTGSKRVRKFLITTSDKTVYEKKKLQEDIARLQEEADCKTVDLTLSKNITIEKDIALNEYRKQIHLSEAKKSVVEKHLKEPIRITGEFNQSVSKYSLLQVELKQNKESDSGIRKKLNEAYKQIKTLKEMNLKKTLENLELKSVKQKLLAMITKYDNLLNALE